MGRRDVLFLGAILGGLGLLSTGLLRSAASTRPAERAAAVAVSGNDDLRSIVRSVDSAFRGQWQERGLRPAPAATELTLMRRLSLALTGTIPSLEEIRRFENKPPQGRVESWLEDLLHDRRYADYLAERLARAYVGTEDGPFIRFRRSRFTNWLSNALLENQPYDAVVREMITSRGVWTDHPATNFLSVTINEETSRPDPERLGARVARAFLGVRLDCAQCHDHPFQPWKQGDFRGLASFFGGVRVDLRGIVDGANDYKPPARKTKEPTAVEPNVPFGKDFLPKTGTPREQLAAWIVDRRNPNFARATVNRMWALLFGRPLSEPIDDLPVAGDLHPALDRLAADFSAHGYDVRRLIRAMCATEAFHRDSVSLESPDGPSQDQVDAWAVFPMTRLRPEQVSGAVFQTSTLSTLGPQSPWVIRLLTYTGQNDFIKRYGDTGEDEFDARGGTIPQRLLLMNGDLVRDRTKDDLFNASTRIAELAPSDRKAIDVAYMTILTRRPTDEESAYFIGRIAGTKGQERKERLTDLSWTLVNTTEFSWNH